MNPVGSINLNLSLPLPASVGELKWKLYIKKELALLPRETSSKHRSNKNITGIFPLILSLLLLPGILIAQPSVDFRGYVKELGSLALNNDLTTANYDNIIHQRHETTIDFGSNFEFQVDLRTRILTGYSIENTPGYADYLSRDPGFVDMSWILFDSKKVILHSTVDRLQLNYYKGSWELTLGRQRLNWGKSYVWNPNDLFNAYAYLDFDYEERPGSDALSIAYNWSYASSINLGFGFGDSWEESILAGMYRGNLGEYDIQAILGSYKGELILGTGWSGYLKNAGFNGELSVFLDNNLGESTLTATLGSDYMFSNGLFLNTAVLYNGGYNSDVNALSQLVEPPSPSNLYIEKTGYFVNGSLAITPLISANLGAMGSFNAPIYIFIPQLSVSLSENLDFLILAQLLKGTQLADFTNTPNLFYFRLKWSY